MDQVPEYEILQDSFYEPNHVLKGSIIRTSSSPGPHLRPLNQAAIVRMEEWYREEFDELDMKTRQKTGKKIYPHEIHRITAGVPGERHDTVIVAGPPKDAPGTLSLPEHMANYRMNTDQRPPGDGTGVRPLAEVPPAPEMGEGGTLVVKEGDGPPVVEVVSATAPPSAKKIS